MRRSKKSRKPLRQEQSVGPRVNEAIRVPEVRLVADDGEQFGIVSISEALQKAADVGLDVVEVSPNATPPVCKLIDYGKYKYQQKRRAQETKKKQVVVELKEIQISPRIDSHDLETKQNHIRRWIAEKARVKCIVFFRGREMTHIDIGRNTLDKLIEGVSDVAQMEGTPKMEGRRLGVMLVPRVESKKNKSSAPSTDTSSVDKTSSSHAEVTPQ